MKLAGWLAFGLLAGSLVALVLAGERSIERGLEARVRAAGMTY